MIWPENLPQHRLMLHASIHRLQIIQVNMFLPQLGFSLNTANFQKLWLVHRPFVKVHLLNSQTQTHTGIL